MCARNNKSQHMRLNSVSLTGRRAAKDSNQAETIPTRDFGSASRIKSWGILGTKAGKHVEVVPIFRHSETRHKNNTHPRLLLPQSRHLPNTSKVQCRKNG